MLLLLATGPLPWLFLAWNSFCFACVLCHFDLHYFCSHCLLTAWDWLSPYHPSAVTSGSVPLSVEHNSTRGFMYVMSYDLFHVLCYFCLIWYIYVSILFPVKMLSGQATHLLRWRHWLCWVTGHGRQGASACGYPGGLGSHTGEQCSVGISQILNLLFKQTFCSISNLRDFRVTGYPEDP